MESRLRGHFEIVSGPNPNARWLKDVVKFFGMLFSIKNQKIMIF